MSISSRTRSCARPATSRAVQEILDARGSNIEEFISKIETQEGLDNIDEIIEASYGIMVARGDLGVELPAEVIPNTQRRIVEKCTGVRQASRDHRHADALLRWSSARARRAPR